MAQLKVGLDYFPYSVGLLKDRKLRKAKLQYGYLACMVYLILLELIFADKGYYLDYSESKRDGVIWDVMEYLQGKYQPPFELVMEIVDCLVACELFSDDHFQRGKLTSKRIQRTFYSATVDRKAVYVDEEIWMLTFKEMVGLSKRSPILENYVDRPKMDDDRPIMDDNRPIIPQSKAEKSKAKKSKGEHSAHAREDTDLDVFSGDLRDAVSDWFAYKAEKNQPYKPVGKKNLIAQIQNKTTAYGAVAVAETIRQSMASNYQGIVFDRMKTQDNKVTNNQTLRYEQRTPVPGEFNDLFS